MAEVRLDFSDSVVLVSGAARGVGREIVAQFIAAGARVVAIDRDSNGLEETVSLVGGSIVPAVVDIRRKSEIQALIKRIDDEFGRVDVCVNNAAVAPHESLMEYRESLWDTMYDVNAKGTFLMTQAVAELMIRRETRGRIINFSSGSALKGGHGSAAYSSSRAATEAFTRVAAMELAPHGILVNTVRPGLIDTQPKPLPPRMKAGLMVRIPTLPLRRPGTPAEVAQVVLFLASPLASYMTGSVVTVDGGASVGTFSDKPI